MYSDQTETSKKFQQSFVLKDAIGKNLKILKRQYLKEANQNILS